MEENSKKEVSVEDILIVTVRELSSMVFPPMNARQTTLMSENVAKPIERSIQNLQSCIEFFVKEREQQMQLNKPLEDAEVIELVPEETTEEG